MCRCRLVQVVPICILKQHVPHPDPSKTTRNKVSLFVLPLFLWKIEFSMYKKCPERKNCRREKLSPSKLSLPPPRPITARAGAHGLLWFAPGSWLRSEWQPQGGWRGAMGGLFFSFLFSLSLSLSPCVAAPLDLKATLVNGGAAVCAGQSTDAARREPVAGGTRTNPPQNTLMAAWEITIHPPFPPFCPLFGTFCFFSRVLN